ncbi:MAG: DoxX family membrane protein, partial [Gemmatimonadetes bacterium]|nr:DoxX family membrane protein [Gemmatimonadota bacterium]NIR42116.1 DoxX family membrane protein [Actinomycetota bacterium]NIS37277.1 DoxX family membrane protein [Actinomycetota bacterium]NIT95707.1 DoxX family membrane protein [Actinomycetota bacterium]NIU71718.1 DoxX family membrane protein [Actinomycetota bacterium]
VRSIDGTAEWFASKGFRNARLNALGASFGELAIGAGLIAGFLTTPAAAGLAAMMATAFGAIHRFAGFFVFARPDEGWEYVATITVGAVVIGL